MVSYQLMIMSQTNAVSHKNLNFYIKKTQKVGTRSITYGIFEGTNAFLKGRKPAISPKNLGYLRWSVKVPM
jgi:hypothetical protein